MEIKTSQEVSKEYNVITDGMTANKRWVAVDDILKHIEVNFVMPFEGTLQGKNMGQIQIHGIITDYNRKKFNKLKNDLYEK